MPVGPACAVFCGAILAAGVSLLPAAHATFCTSGCAFGVCECISGLAECHNNNCEVQAGPIIGVVVGVIVAIALVCLCCCMCCRRLG